MVADLARLIQRGMALWGFDYAAVAKHWGNLVLPEHSSLPPNKGMLKGEPVIAVTGSGQKNTAAPSVPASQRFDGPNCIRERDKLVKARPLLQPPPSVLSSITLSTPFSPPHAFNPDKLGACEVFVAISECLWRTIYREVKHENLF